MVLLSGGQSQAIIKQVARHRDTAEGEDEYYDSPQRHGVPAGRSSKPYSARSALLRTTVLQVMLDDGLGSIGEALDCTFIESISQMNEIAKSSHGGTT